MIVIIGKNTYTETTEISNHSLAKKTGEQIVVKLSYDENRSWSDGPFSVNFGNITMIYSTIDDVLPVPPATTATINLESGDLNKHGSIVSIAGEMFYVIKQENGIVKLLSMYNLHVGNYYTCNEDYECSLMPLSNSTGIQDINTKGKKWDLENEIEIYPYIGTTEFSSADQKGE